MNMSSCERGSLEMSATAGSTYLWLCSIRPVRTTNAFAALTTHDGEDHEGNARCFETPDSLETVVQHVTQRNNSTE